MNSEVEQHPMMPSGTIRKHVCYVQGGVNKEQSHLQLTAVCVCVFLGLVYMCLILCVCVCFMIVYSPLHLHTHTHTLFVILCTQITACLYEILHVFVLGSMRVVACCLHTSVPTMPMLFLCMYVLCVCVISPWPNTHSNRARWDASKSTVTSCKLTCVCVEGVVQREL